MNLQPPSNGGPKTVRRDPLSHTLIVWRLPDGQEDNSGGCGGFHHAVKRPGLRKLAAIWHSAPA
jgi:hypothetical protein